MRSLLHLIKVEYKYSYRSARKDGWSSRYSFTLALTQFLYGIADLIEVREELSRERRTLRRLRRERQRHHHS